MFSIEKGIPIPENVIFRKRASYPFSSMDIGDSFFCQINKKTVSNAAAVAGHRQNKKFLVCKVFGGVRVWRVS